MTGNLTTDHTHEQSSCKLRPWQLLELSGVNRVAVTSESTTQTTHSHYTLPILQKCSLSTHSLSTYCHSDNPEGPLTQLQASIHL